MSASYKNGQSVQHKNQRQQQHELAVVPRSSDILCGKDKFCVDHEGSRRFRSIIECYRTQYQAAQTKYDKTAVTREIYGLLCQVGSRFLKYQQSAGVWEEITPTAARDKIGHALRFANRTSRGSTARKPIDCSVTPLRKHESTNDSKEPVATVALSTREVKSCTGGSNTTPPCATQSKPATKTEQVLKNGHSYLVSALCPISHGSGHSSSHQGQHSQGCNSTLTGALLKDVTYAATKSPGSLIAQDEYFFGAAPFPKLDSGRRMSLIPMSSEAATTPFTTVVASTSDGKHSFCDADFDAEIISVLL